MLTIFQLSRNTLKECLREPVYFLMLITALVMIGLFPSASLFVFRRQLKMVADSSMATTMLFGLFVAVLCAAHTINREMKNGTVLILMSKPVTRVAFIVSKVLGILAALTVFVFICVCGSFASVLVAKDQFWLDNVSLGIYFGLIALSAVFGGVCNFFSQKSFASHSTGALLVTFPILTVSMLTYRLTTMTSMADDEYLPARFLIPALLLLFPAVWTMGAISAALAVRLDFVSNLLICLAIFLIGLVSQYFLHNWFGDSFLRSFLGTLLPNWQFFWMADALTNKAVIPWSYLAWALCYVVFYIVVWTIWAMYLFQDEELAKDSR